GWNQDLAQQGSVRRDAENAFGLPTPEVAVFVAAEAVRIAVLEFVEDAAVREPGPVLRDIEHPDVRPGIAGSLAGLGDIELTLARPEGQPVGRLEDVRGDGEGSGGRVEPVHVARQLL